MANKEYKIQKKKTALTVFLDILFKVLVGIAILIFSFIAYKNMGNTNPSMDFSPNKQGNSNSSVPSSLRWIDPFRGIENVPDKKKMEEKKESNGGTGFSYQGFKK